MHIKVKTLMLLTLSVLAVGQFACNEDQPASQANNDDYLKVQLVGTWDRQWEFGPVVYERTLNLDGTLVMREYRKVQDAVPSKTAATRFHRHYNVDLPLWQENSGIWELHNNEITYKLVLSNGDQMILRYKIEKVSATELLESSTGIDTRVESTYVRLKPGQAVVPKTPSSKPSITG